MGHTYKVPIRRSSLVLPWCHLTKLPSLLMGRMWDNMQPLARLKSYPSTTRRMVKRLKRKEEGESVTYHEFQKKDEASTASAYEGVHNGESLRRIISLFFHCKWIIDAGSIIFRLLLLSCSKSATWRTRILGSHSNGFCSLTKIFAEWNVYLFSLWF